MQQLLEITTARSEYRTSSGLGQDKSVDSSPDRAGVGEVQRELHPMNTPPSIA